MPASVAQSSSRRPRRALVPRDEPPARTSPTSSSASRRKVVASSSSSDRSRRPAPPRRGARRASRARRLRAGGGPARSGGSTFVEHVVHAAVVRCRLCLWSSLMSRTYSPRGAGRRARTRPRRRSPPAPRPWRRRAPLGGAAVDRKERDQQVAGTAASAASTISPTSSRTLSRANDGSSQERSTAIAPWLGVRRVGGATLDPLEASLGSRPSASARPSAWAVAALMEATTSCRPA